MKRKIVVFTGAGISAESGLETFRDADGLWMNHKVEDIATPEGFKRDPELVNAFYNKRRSEAYKAKPNEAHMLLSDLEDKYEVTIVTQNVDSLHERGGSSNVIHLHGELDKVRSVSNPNEIIDWTGDITDEDRGEGNARLRPHIVWFGEMPFGVKEAYKAMEDADIMIVVGTSFNITYTLDMVNSVGIMIPIYFIDPKPDEGVFDFPNRIEYIKEKAVKGMKLVFDKLK
jgi:NAD-dependent deacetylase